MFQEVVTSAFKTEQCKPVVVERITVANDFDAWLRPHLDKHIAGTSFCFFSFFSYFLYNGQPPGQVLAVTSASGSKLLNYVTGNVDVR